MQRMNFRERLRTYEDRPDECWLWPGHVNRSGYGRTATRWKGPMVCVHVLAWEILVGPVPEGLELDHLCKNRRCMNPRHMEPVTHTVNVLRSDNFAGKNHRKTHCDSGHEFTEANTIWSVVNDHGRECRRRSCRICVDRLHAEERGRISADPEKKRKRAEYMRAWKARR